MTADPKPPARVKDPELLAELHREWWACFLCDAIGVRLSVHHVHKHPRDDLRENAVMLCGDGVLGCHGKIEAADLHARAALVVLIKTERPDIIDYLAVKLKTPEAADEWLRSYALGKENR